MWASPAKVQFDVHSEMLISLTFKKNFFKFSLWTVSPCFGFGDFQKERGQTLRGFGVTVEELSAFDVSYSFCEN